MPTRENQISVFREKNRIELQKEAQRLGSLILLANLPYVTFLVFINIFRFCCLQFSFLSSFQTSGLSIMCKVTYHLANQFISIFFSSSK